MNKVLTWAKNNKLNFNEQKSKAMVISRRKRKENKEISVYMNNKILEQVQTFKYLGIIMDSKLTFRDYIMHISSKCNKLIHVLSNSAKQLGAKPRCLAHHIRRSNFTTPITRSAGMDRGTEEGMQQNNLQQSTAPYKDKNSQRFPNYIQ